jgi:hypothetical protein
MTCHRRGGLMVAEHYDDFHDHTGRAVFIGWRCVNCGAILDPVIAVNRRSHGHRTVSSQSAATRTMDAAAALQRSECFAHVRLK